MVVVQVGAFQVDSLLDPRMVLTMRIAGVFARCFGCLGSHIDLIRLLLVHQVDADSTPVFWIVASTCCPWLLNKAFSVLGAKDRHVDCLQFM